MTGKEIRLCLRVLRRSARSVHCPRARRLSHHPVQSKPARRRHSEADRHVSFSYAELPDVARRSVRLEADTSGDRRRRFRAALRSVARRLARAPPRLPARRPCGAAKISAGRITRGHGVGRSRPCRGGALDKVVALAAAFPEGDNRRIAYGGSATHLEIVDRLSGDAKDSSPFFCYMRGGDARPLMRRSSWPHRPRDVRPLEAGSRGAARRVEPPATTIVRAKTPAPNSMGLPGGLKPTCAQSHLPFC